MRQVVYERKKSKKELKRCISDLTEYFRYGTTDFSPYGDTFTIPLPVFEEMMKIIKNMQNRIQEL